MLFVAPYINDAEEDLCKETGIVAKNATFVPIWYKRNEGDCTLWQRNKLLVIRPGDSVDIFSDMNCKTKYCSDMKMYENFKSFDSNNNCRMKISTGCNLSDM